MGLFQSVWACFKTPSLWFINHRIKMMFENGELTNFLSEAAGRRCQFRRLSFVSSSETSMKKPVFIVLLERKNGFRFIIMLLSFLVFGFSVEMKFLGWYVKIGTVSVLIGASMEMFMIKTGFCVRTLLFPPSSIHRCLLLFISCIQLKYLWKWLLRLHF